MSQVRIVVCASEKDADVELALLQSSAGGFGAKTVEKNKVARMTYDASKTDDGTTDMHKNVWVVIGWN